MDYDKSLDQKHYKRLFLISILLAVVFIIIQQEFIFGSIPLSHAQLQFVFFPLILLLIWSANWSFIRVPNSLIIVMALCGLMSVWISHKVFSNGEGAFHIARLADDPYESETHIFRDSINRFYPWNSSLRAFRYWDSVNSREVAEGIIRDEQDINALIWGDQKRLFISFGEMQSVNLGSISGVAGDPDLFSIELITRVPIVGMPYGPARALHEFVAHLFSGYMPLAQRNTRVSGGMGSRHEIDLRTAARIVAGWRTEEHRGFAWWLLGNLYLKKALIEPASMRGYFQCAARAYEVAASYVNRAENPELFAAVHNNYAVLLLAKKFLAGTKTKIKKASASLAYARTARRIEGNYSAKPGNLSVLARNKRNLIKLKKSFKEQSRKLRKKQRRRRQK